MLYLADWRATWATKVVPLVPLVITESTTSGQNLVDVKVTLECLERDTREDLVYMSTSDAFIVVALPFRYGSGLRVVCLTIKFT